MFSMKTSPRKISSLNEIFEIYFLYIKYYTQRLEYSMLEYHTRTIEWNLKRMRRYVMVTTQTILLILFFWILIFWKNCPIEAVNDFASIIPFDGFKLMLSYYSILIILLEIMSFILMRLTINYNYRFNNALNELIQIDHYKDRFFDLKILDNLQENHSKLVFCLNFVYHSVITVMLAILFPLEINLLLKFLIEQIQLLELVCSSLIYYNFFDRFRLLAGQLFHELFDFAFVGYFFLRKFKHLVRTFRKISEKKCSIKQIKAVSDYSREYIRQSRNVSLMNQSKREVFFIIETSSKLSIVFAMLFYNGQNEMNLLGYTVILLIGIFWFVNTALSANVASFNTLNNSFFRSIYSWKCEYFQKKFQNSKSFKIFNRSYLSNETRKNFFIQNVSRNPIGFTCGRIFQITQFRYIELQLLNIVLLLSFYQRFLL